MDVEDYVLIIAPQFTGVDMTGAIAIAELKVGVNVCGNKRPLLLAYLVAHILTEALRNSGDKGSITALSEGGLSIKYSELTIDSNNSYSGTIYGIEFWTMLRSCLITPMTSGDYGCS